jgi:hypothetical protein
MNSPRLGNLNDRQINTYLRTLAFLLSNAVAKLNSVMSYALARPKLPSVDGIQSSFLENGRPRFGCCVYYGSILGNVELYLNYPLNSCLPCKRRIARQVVRTIRLGGGEHNGQGEHNEKKRNESPHDLYPQRARGTISLIEQTQSHEPASERVPRRSDQLHADTAHTRVMVTKTSSPLSESFAPPFCVALASNRSARSSCRRYDS